MQEEAVHYNEGPLLILAGAGSGKTSTMTHKIAHLVKDEGVDPSSILAVTFTNKAAKEMRDRVGTLLGVSVSGDSWRSGGMWILTFHGACLRILRQNSEAIGYSKNFVVYDPTDQKVVGKESVKRLGLDEKKLAPNYILTIISKCKEQGQKADEYEGYADRNPSHQQIAKIYKAYETTLRKNEAMDFDDLLMNTVELFKAHPEVLKYYQDKFKYIMVDEYQDTNFIQYTLVKMLAEKHRNICVVGDEDQCIYQWRGADINNILDFERDFKGAKVVKLEQNYRSLGNILDAANSVIKNNEQRKGKELWTDAEAGEKIQFILTHDEKEEARAIAREILSEVSCGRNFRDFAVLYRTNVQSRTFEEVFPSAGIPYQVVGGTRYYDRKEVKDMMCYLRLISDKDDDLSLKRVINEPKRGIGAKTLAGIVAQAEANGISIYDLLSHEQVQEQFSPKVRAGISNFIETIGSLTEQINSMKISEIYDAVMIRSGYIAALEDVGSVEAEGRIENLLEFKSVILEYEKEDPQITLPELLERVSLVADIDNHDRSENAVTLMTLHSAKGLEFPVVFMPGMEEGLFPGSRSIESLDGIEEERRLCYVGMTRAMKKLYMLRASARTIYGRYEQTYESRFLKEIDKKFMDGADKIGKDVTGYFHGAMGGNDGFSRPVVVNPYANLRKIKGEIASQSRSEARAKDGRNSTRLDTAVSPVGSASHVIPASPVIPAKAGISADTILSHGDKVSHPKFGEGLVLEGDDKTVTVIFATEGKKKLALGMAPLEKIG
jgi:DNA helicase-2/ATP-dependent DNA helicase PcrA